MTENVYNRIKIVHVYYGSFIVGFKFFDKDHSQIWDIGEVDQKECKVDEVVLNEKERIVGVSAKLWGGSKSIYSNLRF